MHSLHTFSRQVFVGVFLCSVCACSPGYQSYRDGGYEEAVKAGQRWEVQLPYHSSKGLEIAVVASDEILLTDKDGPLHITRIPLNVAGVPGRIRQVALDGADSMEVLDETQLLVSAPAGNAAKHLRFVDRASLEVAYSVDLPFAESSDFTVPGWKRFGDVLVVYQSSIALAERSWSDSSYEYTLKYIASAKYDLHVIDLHRRTVKSVAGLEGRGLERIRTQILACKAAVDALADSQASLKFMAHKPNLESYVYLVDDIFLVDRGGVLVFELKNLKGDSEYFTVDIRNQNPTPKREVASELAARYPTELVATPHPEKDRVMKIRGIPYHVERLALLEAGLVAILQEPSPQEPFPFDDERKYSDSWVVMGIRPSATKPDEWDRTWGGHPLLYEHPVKTLLEDPARGVIYFPDAVDSNARSRFVVRGLRVKDGQSVSGFPANFQTHFDSAGEWVRITGTAVDFGRNRLYIHDASKNRVVAVELKLAR